MLLLMSDEENGAAGVGAPYFVEARPELCPDFIVGEGAGERVSQVKTVTLDALAGPDAEKDKVKSLERRVSDLEKQLAVADVAHKQALDKLKRLEGVERENERLRLLVERYEFQIDNGVNPGPY